MAGSGEPEDRDPRPADEQLRLPAIAGAMDVDDVAADPDEPPLVGGAGRDPQLERPTAADAEPADRDRPGSAARRTPGRPRR